MQLARIATPSLARRLLFPPAMRTASRELSVPRAIAAALVALATMVATVLLGGCGASPGTSANPNANLFRDFTDGKFDAAGHPLNATVVAASALCPNGGSTNGNAVTLAQTCAGAVPGASQSGDLAVNARLRVDTYGADPIVSISVLAAADGHVLARDALTATRLRQSGAWIDFSLGWTSDGSPARIAIVPGAGATIEVEYVETFPRHFGLVIAPGSGPIANTDTLELEFANDHSVTAISLDGTDLTAALSQLLASGTATRAMTDLRTVLDIPVGALAPTRGDVAELQVRTGDAARVELRRTPPACNYEGDPTAPTSVVVTGFQPFPADATHDNVSAVAVTALDPGALRGARVMRVVLPVEYDRAGAELADIVARCAPDVVISFGQGGDEIALEETAYNLEDTGEVAGGVPDNRGIVRAAVPIDPSAPATRATLLPIAEIERALRAIGESPQHSTDPGRYVCNDVMFAGLGAIASTNGRAGFIHLPYTDEFDDATRARFGKLVAAAIQATVDAR